VKNSLADPAGVGRRNQDNNRRKISECGDGTRQGPRWRKTGQGWRTHAKFPLLLRAILNVPNFIGKGLGATEKTSRGELQDRPAKIDQGADSNAYAGGARKILFDKDAR